MFLFRDTNLIVERYFIYSSSTPKTTQLSLSAASSLLFGRVYFLLRSISPSQIHLRFKTEKPSQIHLKCEKGYILKSTSSDNLLKTISRHTRWTFSIRIPSQILLKSPSSDNLLKTISAHSQMEYVFYFSKPS